VDKASAGCLVGQSKTGHREFMAVVKSDPRYQADRKHVFATAILPESDVLAVGEVEPIVVPTDHGPPPSSDVRDDVRRLQKLLGFSEEEQDGIFGAITEEALKRFQRSHGLRVTGEVNDVTRDTLEREAAGTLPPGGKQTERVEEQPKTSEEPIDINLGPGGGIMNPLILIAAQFLPDIAKAVVGDKAGTVAGAVIKAVTEITRTANPDEVRNKLKADPAAVAALQLKLAEIANAEEEARQKAQLDLLKEQHEAEAKKTEANLKALQAGLEDVKNARGTYTTLALAKSPMAWGAPIVSVIVTAGFFVILMYTPFTP
jgi:peptidoglycan hydrolase-like protein with peptidoglycan-binding domain